jgi:hypothetical protein
MILHLNHTRRDSAAASASEAVGTFLTLLEEGHLTPAQFARLQVYLDWLQYKQNFREPVTVVEAPGQSGGGGPSGMEVRIDSRQVSPGSLRELVKNAIGRATADRANAEDRIYLEEFRTLRTSVVWSFNHLYWQRLRDWEEATGKSYEKALPGGVSDGHHPQAIADSAKEFWKVLKELETRHQLPPEIFILEIGVGLATRAGMWLDRFCALDQENGTHYYPRLRVLLGDYSLSTLDRSRPAVRQHIDLCSFIALDALDPTKTLSFLRHKVLHVHSSNTYDNLPDEELVWRDNRLYWVQVRAYIPAREAARIAASCQVAPAEIARTVKRLLEVGADTLPEHERGMAFWMNAWNAIRLEERLVDQLNLPDAELPAGLSYPQMEDFLRDAPGELRFHLSSGALESFRNTLPLLHPRGYLQVQDIFVTDWSDYSVGFYGPGKLDGSIVNWVNGALLREVAHRAGYDLHFVPFPYRAGSKTSILYTTERE